MKDVKFWITVLLLVGAILRLTPADFPALTADEARIAIRGDNLITQGKDELGRQFPLIFNSMTDYQLPLVSYLAIPGARTIFAIVGVALIFLVYKIARELGGEKVGLMSAFFVAFSPTLIFLSKVPNETIVLTFFIMLITLNLPLLLIVVTLAFLTSKIAWFVIPPFLLLTKKIKIGILALFFSALVIILFLNIPQGKRSLIENNFPILQNTSIVSSINFLRGEDQRIIWPLSLEKLILNKSHVMLAGFFHWMSNMSPVLLFGQFDATGLKGFMSMGAFPKIAAIPFVFGLMFIVKSKDRKFMKLIWYVLVLSAPLIFLYPHDGQDLVVLTLPFMAIIMALGLAKFNNFLKFSILTLAVFEVMINLFFLSPEVKNAVNIRPAWIKEITTEAFKLSAQDKVAVSDNLVSDIAPFIKWFTSKEEKEYFSDMYFPYKFRQSKVSNIKIIGSEDSFYKCGLDAPTFIFASKRDLQKIHYFLNLTIAETVEKTYFDSLGEEIAYQLKPTICVK